MNLNNLEQIKEEIRTFFDKTTFDLDVDVSLKENSTIFINVNSREPQILIGEGGQTLIDIQRLLKMMLKKKTSDKIYVDLDINNYKKRKMDNLKDLARQTADEVVLANEEKILFAMPPYERRVVHLELAKRLDIATESVGNDPNRKIIIKPL